MAEIETIDIATDKQVRMRSSLAFKRTFKKLASMKKPWECSWQELHDLRSQIGSEMDDFINKTEEEKRTLLEPENLAWTHGMYLLERIGEEFRNREKHGTKDPVNYEKMAEEFHRSRSTEREISTITGGKEYRSLFYPGQSHVELSNDGFRNIAEFFQAVASKQVDPRLREAKTETRTNIAGTGVSGGFAVPEGFTEILMDRALLADEIFRPRALVLPMETGTVSAPRFDADDRSDSTLFGLELKFYGENAEMDSQNAKMKSQIITARKAAIYWQESRELLQDSPAFHQKLITLLPRVIARGLDKHFYSGNGVQGPQGIIYAASTLSVARNTAGSILYADIKNLWGKLHSACHGNSVWITNSASIPSLLSLKDDNNNSIWHPGMGGSVKDGMPMTLFGRPILLCETAPAVGTLGDICLADLTQYVIGLRQEMIVESSEGPGFSRDAMSFKITLRIDGRPIFWDPIKMEDESYLSWAAVLA